MEWSKAKVNRILTREHTGHNKYPLPATQEKTLHMDMTKWSTPKSDWLYSLQPKLEKLYIGSKNKTGSWLWVHDSDHELLIAKLTLKLKKVGRTIRPFRYDLNQIPYDYTVKVKNRFKGLDLIDSVSEELWTEVRDIIQETGIKIIPKKKKCKEAKWLSEEALEVAEKWRKVKSKGERKEYPSECRVLKNSKEGKEGLLKWTMQRSRGKQ